MTTGLSRAGCGDTSGDGVCFAAGAGRSRTGDTAGGPEACGCAWRAAPPACCAPGPGSITDAGKFLRGSPRGITVASGLLRAGRGAGSRASGCTVPRLAAAPTVPGDPARGTDTVLPGPSSWT